MEKFQAISQERKLPQNHVYGRASLINCDLENRAVSKLTHFFLENFKYMFNIHTYEQICQPAFKTLQKKCT